MLHPTLTIALKAARAAGDIILRSLDFLDRITFTQKTTNQYVSEVDKLAEKEIISVLRSAFPQHAMLGEETGRHKGDDHVWIIDPLDGTTNFMHGMPHFCVSIALQYKGRIEQALIYDPIRQEVFSASRGRGAQLNEKRIRVSKTSTLNTALLSTGFPHRNFETLLSAYMKILETLIPHAGGIRRPGAAALDLAYVAAGRYDGFWEFNLKPWDMAAGALLVQEAGGLVSDIRGGEDYLKNGHIVAGNPKIFKQLLQIIKPVTEENIKI